MEKLKKIKMILMDVDGVLTDGKIYYTSSGEEIKAFDIQDGMGITLARKAGLQTGIITGRTSEMVSRRAKELQYDVVLQGDSNKLAQFEKIKAEFAVTDQQVCYIGDDIPDIPLLKKVGFSVAVANARDELKQFCDYITERDGGHGAVREVIDKILLSQGN
jgi:3-deoxy-D-manno-octulosonate 8-phosphate phosphatase (KDO 8-P phosphatase)